MHRRRLQRERRAGRRRGGGNGEHEQAEEEGASHASLIGDYPRQLKRRDERAPASLPMTDDAPILRETLADLAVVVLTLNRPKALNALSDVVMGALGDELSAVEADDSARCVVLLGAVARSRRAPT